MTNSVQSGILDSSEVCVPRRSDVHLDRKKRPP